MEVGSRCPRCGFENPTVAALSEALLAIGRERSVGATLRQIVDAVRRLASARASALGIVGEDGGFEQFIVSGAVGSHEAGRAPDNDGLLRATLEERAPLRVPNVRDDPRAPGSPAMLTELGSFMGVPLISDEGVVGAFYLLGREGAPSFTAPDQEAVQMLASHAILAIEGARLYERNRELTVVEERNRLARELHDAVSQTLFSIVLTAGTAATLLERDPPAAREQIEDLRALAQDAQREMRSLIFELRPAEIEREGLVPTIRKHVEVLRRVHPVEIELRVGAERRLAPPVEKELFRITQEALSNALRHSAAMRVRIELEFDPTGARLLVADDGKGFDRAETEATSRRFGLTSMRERVQALGGILSIDSVPGRGTSVSVEVPDGR